MNGDRNNASKADSGAVTRGDASNDAHEVRQPEDHSRLNNEKGDPKEAGGRYGW